VAIQLTEEWTTAINNAYGDGYPILWSTVDEDGQPVLAFFGTTQVFSEHELALWMRTLDRGFLRRIAVNPKVSLMYRNSASRLAFQIHGEARRVDDDAVRNRVWENSHPEEQERDPERQGTAVIVDVTRVIVRGEVVQSRD
jgi:predicted pyridoxine 5'-phosphate oxidase superfamily flavin-nucleotide-binding protein